jgi:hypothetical protein
LQAFFHAAFDRLPAVEQARLANDGTLFSALGTTRDFFTGPGPFSLPAFKAWVAAGLGEEAQTQAGELSRWLPAALFEGDAGGDAARLQRARPDFLAATAAGLLRSLDQMAGQTMPPAQDEPGETGDGAGHLLLDRLFDAGLLPSYAFPTELCSFTVFAAADGRVRVKERPQQAKDKALSEYAPGRLLVINKETFRVGGIFAPGTRQSATPMRERLGGELPHYVYCPGCTYIRLGRPSRPDERCPICRTGLAAREMLDPPGFSPAGGRPLQEHDADQEFSYATGAQLPLPVADEQIAWGSGCGVHLRHALGMDQQLVVVNAGPSERGFAICELCGAAWPQESAPKTGEHARPFLIEHGVLDRERARRTCSGRLRSSVYLGHAYRTDLLLLRLRLAHPLACGPQDPWVHDALRTLAEAVALAASLELDVDPNELSAGYRLIPGDLTASPDGTSLAADIFLYDTASGGAGYAVEAGEALDTILDRTLDLLLHCPRACPRSCVGCLRHYANRFWHERLDRHLAAGLLGFVRTGTAPNRATPEQQASDLIGLKRYLELEGWNCSSRLDDPRQRAPLLIARLGEPASQPGIAIWTCSALMDPRMISRQEDLRDHGPAVVLRDYVVARDLPTAFDAVRDWLRVTDR